MLSPWVRSLWWTGDHSPRRRSAVLTMGVSSVCVWVTSTDPRIRANIWLMFCPIFFGSKELFCECILPSLIYLGLLISPLKHLSQQDHPKEQSSALLFRCTLYIFSIINFMMFVSLRLCREMCPYSLLWIADQCNFNSIEIKNSGYLEKEGQSSSPSATATGILPDPVHFAHLMENCGSKGTPGSHYKG